jgi:PTH1 family peptidyl-tRNA hydrolase
MILIVGLGNIGPKYIHTRHNIGFMVLDALADNWQEETKFQALTSKIQYQGQEGVLAKPTTMMNNSGEAVGKLAQHFKIAPQDIWIIYDELDLSLGRLKVATGSSDNGHNGLISISQRLGHNRFWRFKIGVDTRIHREIPGLEYVLQPFAQSDQPLLDQSLEVSTKAIRLALVSTPQAAMQEYNKAASPSKDQASKDPSIQASS